MSKHLRLFIAGDSTAQSYKPEMAPQAGWGQLLPLFFDEDVEIINHAMAGRSSKSFFNEGRYGRILEAAKKDDYVIIQFGHNDGTVEKPERYIPFPDFEELLEKEYIAPALARGMHPILASHTQGSWFDEASGTIPEPTAEESYPLLFQKHAKLHGFPFLDINTLSRKMENKFGPVESKKLHLYAKPGEYERFPDGNVDDTHFCFYGAFLIAEITANELCRQIPEFAAHRKDAYIQVKEVKGDTDFDVRPYGFTDTFSVAIDSKGGEVFVGGRKVMNDRTENLVTRCTAANGHITVSAENATVQVSPVWIYAPEGGIHTEELSFVLDDLPDGRCDITFVKSDINRSNLYLNSLIVGVNVDMEGTVEQFPGTRHTIRDFQVTCGASVKGTEKTHDLKAVEVTRTPVIFPRKKRIFIGGDSTVCLYYPVIPQTQESEIKPGTVRTGWGQLIDRYLSDEYEIVDLASSGDWAWDWKFNIFPTITYLAQKDDIFLLQFGINDRNREDKQVPTMTGAIVYMMEAAKKLGLKTVLIKPQPSVGYSWGTAGDHEKPNGTNAGFFTAIPGIAEKCGVEFLDLFSMAGDHFAEVGKDYVARNYHLWDLEKDEIADRMHLSFMGAGKLAEIVAGELSARGIVNTKPYLKNTKIDDELYTFQNSEITRYVNLTANDREADGIVIAPYSTATLRN